MTPTQSAAEQYIKLGWYLVPIPPGTKGPNTPGWNTPANCISTRADCKFWAKNPDWNMGVLLSESRLAVLDVDHLDHCRQIFDAMGLDYDAIMGSAPRIKSRPSRDKAVFRMPPGANLTRRVVNWPTLDHKTHTAILELRAGAVQDVLPPSIHPTTRKPYEWATEPFDGIPELPAPILKIWREWDRFGKQMESVCPWAKAQTKPPLTTRQVGSSGESVIGKFNEAHDIETMLDHYGYKRTKGGRYLSPHSSSGLAGVVVWPDENRAYSHHASEPFDTSHGIDPFHLFCHYDCGGDVHRAVREAAQRLNLDAPSTVDEEAIEHGKQVFNRWRRPKDDESTELLNVPGILQHAVDYYNTTAPKPQPRFAVQSALALGSVAMGRRWRTDQMNYSGLYLVCVGKSASGKEHNKTVVEKLMEAAGIDDRIGPPGYTSASGILSQLIAKPTHLAIIDELGKQLETSGAKINAHKAEAMTQIMEAFGRQGGTMRAQGYSTMTLNAKQRQELSTENLRVVHPCLSILAMTTPRTLYESISSAYVHDGFLGRFVIVETDVGRQASRMVNWIDPSPKLIDWIKESATATAGTGNLSDVDTHLQPPEPVVVPFDQRCHAMIREYDDELLRLMDEAEEWNMSEMYGRSKEIAMRIGLILARSCGSSMVLPDHLDWAIKYTRKYIKQTVSRLRRSMSDSPFEAACKEVYYFILAGGLRGRTEYEVSRGCKSYRSLVPRQRAEVIEAVQKDYNVTYQDVATRGRTRRAWVASGDE